MTAISDRIQFFYLSSQAIIYPTTFEPAKLTWHLPVIAGIYILEAEVVHESTVKRSNLLKSSKYHSSICLVTIVSSESA